LFSLKSGKNGVKKRKLAQKGERKLAKEWMAGSVVYGLKKGKNSA
jgi:hypothetical protein